MATIQSTLDLIEALRQQTPANSISPDSLATILRSMADLLAQFIANTEYKSTDDLTAAITAIVDKQLATETTDRTLADTALQANIDKKLDKTGPYLRGWASPVSRVNQGAKYNFLQLLYYLNNKQSYDANNIVGVDGTLTLQSTTSGGNTFPLLGVNKSAVVADEASARQTADNTLQANINKKQDKLKAGTGISINADNTVEVNADDLVGYGLVIDATGALDVDTDEIARVVDVDAVKNSVSAETTRAKAAEEANATAISDEAARAKAAEEANATAISNEASERQRRDGETLQAATTIANTVQGNLDAVEKNLKKAVDTLQTNIDKKQDVLSLAEPIYMQEDNTIGLRIKEGKGLVRYDDNIHGDDTGLAIDLGHGGTTASGAVIFEKDNGELRFDEEGALRLSTQVTNKLAQIEANTTAISEETARAKAAEEELTYNLNNTNANISSDRKDFNQHVIDANRTTQTLQENIDKKQDKLTHYSETSTADGKPLAQTNLAEGFVSLSSGTTEVAEIVVGSTKDASGKPQSSISLSVGNGPALSLTKEGAYLDGEKLTAGTGGGDASEEAARAKAAETTLQGNIDKKQDKLTYYSAGTNTSGVYVDGFSLPDGEAYLLSGGNGFSASYNPTTGKGTCVISGPGHHISIEDDAVWVNTNRLVTDATTGNKNFLATTKKTTLVDAINELVTRVAALEKK